MSLKRGGNKVAKPVDCWVVSNVGVRVTKPRRRRSGALVRVSLTHKASWGFVGGKNYGVPHGG